jgi:hypothetical protein
MEIISMQYDNPSPEILMESAFRQTFSNKPIEPMYLRLSDAENNLDKIAKERGVQIKDFYAWAGLKKC